MDAYSEHLTDADVAFILWMNGLDAVEVAKTNSFHSVAHRNVLVSQIERKIIKPRVMSAQPAKVVKRKRKKETLSFTAKQIEIAVAALERTNNV